MLILGISAHYHDSAAALLRDGKLVAAAQEERFTRKKHDAAFPAQAIRTCLREIGAGFSDIDAVVFYDKPLIKFDRLLQTYLAYAPEGYPSFVKAMPLWIKEKLFLKSLLQEELQRLSGLALDKLPPLLFNEHHQSHAASAFFPSPYESAAVLCLDGVGEWATSSLWVGEGNSLRPLWEIHFPHSLGLLYSAFTYFTGFKVNSGEYKLMGLAPYGEPKYVKRIYDNLIDVKEDGSFRLNMKFFGYATGLTMTNDAFAGLFGGPRRAEESPLTQREMDIARSVQVVTEEIVLKLAETAHAQTGRENLCLAGGVALNCVANGRLLQEGPFRKIWIQPAAGDAGGAVGAAYSAWHEHFGKARAVAGSHADGMQGAYLGNSYSRDGIKAALDSLGARYEEVGEENIPEQTAKRIAEGAVIGWFQGRMEFGPRALGARSILGDPRNEKMQSTMNMKIKFRESFRPFAPAVLEEKAPEIFALSGKSPYMLLVAPVREEHRLPPPEGSEKLFGIEKLKLKRSKFPAVTHVDYSARIQTVGRDSNPLFRKLLESFQEKTGCPMLVNTSFNVRGEPIVCTPEDAYRCFRRTDMDALSIGPFFLEKSKQKPWTEGDGWKSILKAD